MRFKVKMIYFCTFTWTSTKENPENSFNTYSPLWWRGIIWLNQGFKWFGFKKLAIFLLLYFLFFFLLETVADWMFGRFNCLIQWQFTQFSFKYLWKPKSGLRRCCHLSANVVAILQWVLNVAHPPVCLCCWWLPGRLHTTGKNLWLVTTIYTPKFQKGRSSTWSWTKPSQVDRVDTPALWR